MLVFTSLPFYMVSHALFLLLPVFAPAIVAAETETPNEFIRIVARDATAHADNQHPFRIRPQRLAQVLEQLRIVSVSKRSATADDAMPMFSTAVAQRLGGSLADALRRARSNHDVIFQVVDTVPFLGSLFDRDVITNGRVFRRGNRLNIIFGAIHHRTKKRWMLGRVVGTINPPVLPTRKRSAKLDYRVVTQAGIRPVKTRSGSVRPDWILIDFRRTDGLLQSNARSKPKAAMRAAPLSLEQRLQRLTALRERGLISERQYQIKIQQILDDL